MFYHMLKISSGGPPEENLEQVVLDGIHLVPCRGKASNTQPKESKGQPWKQMWAGATAH